MTDCKINCETLICEYCKRPVPSCNVKRNCSKLINGPGKELKKLLSKLGIKADSGCKCSDRAKHMDYMEQTDPGWCERNIDTIVGWLEEEAKKRKLPFIKTIAKMLVKRAIKNAQRN